MHQLWEWVEAHGAIVFPAIAAVVIGLLVFSVLRGWKAVELSAEEKRRLKADIMRLMRKLPAGVSAEAVAKEFAVDVFHAATLLREMEDEGLIQESTMTSGVSAYRLKGL
jgi:hypothetical protein